MKRDWLNSKDICKILDSCSKNGVTELCFEGIIVKFTGQPIQPIITWSKQPTLSEEKENSSEVSKEMALEADQIQLEQMMIEDPVAYERHLINGDLDAQ